jgi:hypothetical protein
MPNVVAAVRMARAVEEGKAAPPRARPPATRWLVAGDPQTTPTRFFTVLDRHGALGPDGLLAEGVGLVSIGDHFDFLMGAPEAEPAGREILAWLAYQRPSVVILLGNHDVARVSELAVLSDADFAEAKAAAQAIARAERAEQAAEVEARLTRFFERFPDIPSPGMVLKDVASFSEAQRALVQRLLLDGTLRLAALARVHGQLSLLTHAGVTQRELSILGCAADATAVKRALDARLAQALGSVAPRWQRGERVALDLAPLHVSGRARREGGGLLYHRPVRSDRPGADAAWELAPDAPRRFDPRALPRGLVQVVGHSGHSRTARDLPGWVARGAEREGVSLRTLAVAGDAPRYEAGIQPAVAGEATLYMIDPGFAHEPIEAIELLAVDDVLRDA